MLEGNPGVPFPICDPETCLSLLLRLPGAVIPEVLWKVAVAGQAVLICSHPMPLYRLSDDSLVTIIIFMPICWY